MFANATMARIYVMQGKYREAENILSMLASGRPSDEELQRELATVRAKRIAQELSEQSSDSHVALQIKDGELIAEWSLPAIALDRARLVLAEPGIAILRCITHPFGAPPRIVDVNLVENGKTKPSQNLDGRKSFPLADGPAYVVASVGIRNRRGRFVSAAHTEPMRIAPEQG